MNKKVFIRMNYVLFFLFLIISFGLIYFVHKYFGKQEFYLLGIVYSVISFVMSFKMIKIYGLNINMGIIFSSGLLGIMYYFINKFNDKDGKKFIFTIMISIMTFIIFILSISIMIPSMYDEYLVLFKKLIFDNYTILFLYPIGLFCSLLFTNYSFTELKKINKNKKMYAIISLIGITFIDVFVCIYFSYAIINGFNNSHFVAVDNYFIMTIIMIVMYFLINKIIKIKKVKS